MGYMTPVLFLNDAFHVIKNNPNMVVQHVLDGMEQKTIFEEYGVKGHQNCMHVLQSHHTNLPHLILSHGNSMMYLGQQNHVENIEYRKMMLERAKQIIQEEERAILELERSGKGL